MYCKEDNRKSLSHSLSLVSDVTVQVGAVVMQLDDGHTSVEDARHNAAVRQQQSRQSSQHADTARLVCMAGVISPVGHEPERSIFLHTSHTPTQLQCRFSISLITHENY